MKPMFWKVVVTILGERFERENLRSKDEALSLGKKLSERLGRDGIDRIEVWRGSSLLIEVETSKGLVKREEFVGRGFVFGTRSDHVVSLKEFDF